MTHKEPHSLKDLIRDLTEDQAKFCLVSLVAADRVSESLMRQTVEFSKSYVWKI